MMVRTGTRITCTLRYAHACGACTYGSTSTVALPGMLVPVRPGTSAVLVVASSRNMILESCLDDGTSRYAYAV